MSRYDVAIVVTCFNEDVYRLVDDTLARFVCGMCSKYSAEKTFYIDVQPAVESSLNGFHIFYGMWIVAAEQFFGDGEDVVRRIEGYTILAVYDICEKPEVFHKLVVNDVVSSCSCSAIAVWP